MCIFRGFSINWRRMEPVDVICLKYIYKNISSSTWCFSKDRRVLLVASTGSLGNPKEFGNNSSCLSAGRVASVTSCPVTGLGWLTGQGLPWLPRWWSLLKKYHSPRGGGSAKEVSQSPRWWGLLKKYHSHRTCW